MAWHADRIPLVTNDTRMYIVHVYDAVHCVEAQQEAAIVYLTYVYIKHHDDNNMFSSLLNIVLLRCCCRHRCYFVLTTEMFTANVSFIRIFSVVCALIIFIYSYFLLLL